MSAGWTRSVGVGGRDRHAALGRVGCWLVAGRWSLVNSPNPQAPQGELPGVSCGSASAAVGHSTTSTGRTVTLAEWWNGTSWAIQTTPNPTGALGSELSAVSCSSASACIAVGFYDRQ